MNEHLKIKINERRRALYELCALNSLMMQIYKIKADQWLFLLGVWIRSYWLRAGKQLELPKTWRFIKEITLCLVFGMGRFFLHESIMEVCECKHL